MSTTLQHASALALQHHNAGRLPEAEALYRQILTLQPKHAGAIHHLGVIALQTGRSSEAVELIRRALLIRPNYPEAQSNLGSALRINEEIDEAIAACRQSIALRPTYAEAYNNLGNALRDGGRLDEAMAAYRQAVALNPSNVSAHSNLVYTMYFDSTCDEKAIAEEQRRWADTHADTVKNRFSIHQNDRCPERALKIGYISPDLRDHVVGRNLLPLFCNHDRRLFEITCYAQVLKPDAITDHFQRLADRWRSIVGLSDDQVGQQICEDRIDILVDLTLHMAGNRLRVFARKPAPIQLTYLAYCGSSGISTIDYRFSDPHLDPPQSDLSCYTERTILLPKTYWCYQPHPAPLPAPLPALANGFITFGCLNHLAKVSVAAIALWARILLAIPNSRLLLHAPKGTHRDEIAGRLERAGITTDRLQFIGTLPWSEYIETYSRIDIALDPMPYGGGITTLDGLWMGVPVITLSGGRAVGRGGRSILSNLGLPQLIAFDDEKYVKIAIDLSGDTKRLNALRTGLRARLLKSPLMDGEAFARDVEAAYRRMWHDWCRTAPTPVEIAGKSLRTGGA